MQVYSETLLEHVEFNVNYEPAFEANSAFSIDFKQGDNQFSVDMDREEVVQLIIKLERALVVQKEGYTYV